jgi:hypothetical protein
MRLNERIKAAIEGVIESGVAGEHELYNVGEGVEVTA